MKLASVNPIFYDLASDLDTLLVRPEQSYKHNFSASSKASSKESKRIDSLFYSYANGSTGLIE
ncbi:hypothetical protein JHK87_001771 [Glycine soja]|nr:hypothetical protein JHK87_001771 [Glycine soja]